MLTPVRISTDAERAAFATECFRSWLNRIDARITYDDRRAFGTVSEWRWHFDHGNSENEAIVDMRAAFNARCYCS